ncbi:hypothetical protein EIN_398090 [Entamoeba invadens IP1]|uniref:Arrestin C-terminal-like domain-containing protein n=1 Tax=Entamoeba invadens IP1 TaxID=370355 RepID=A0A0A1UFS4_ENTIV|nr:hypothetical protein EIN_398090 [Entamoeba invadens IP1]ELP91879.1 hypothetical protein EIN_398090 [Entamoeba invadens IP1]|eukprot:XP_004258650.1 hypothetical protein EIN_398090 [Entamoeba invadens IP1]
MEVRCFIEKGGYTSEPYFGRVEIKVKKISFVSGGMIVLKWKDTMFNIFGNAGELRAKDETNSLEPPQIPFNEYVQFVQDQIMSFPIPTLDSPMNKELCPGLHIFPFCITLPEDLSPDISLFDGAMKHMYILLVSLVTPTGFILSEEIECPVIFNSMEIPPSLPTSSSRIVGMTKVTLSLDKQNFQVGETVHFHVSFKSLRLEGIPEMSASIIGVHSIYYQTQHVDVATLSLEPSQLDDELELTLDIPKTAAPTLITQNFMYKHFICIMMVSKSKKKEAAFFPITIYGKKPANLSDCQNLVNRYKNEEVTFSKTPQLNIKSENCIETVKTSTGDVIYLDHLKRVVYADKAFTKSSMIYPFVDSETLPEGLSYGLEKNKRVIVDHTKGLVFYEHQFPLPVESQAQINDFTDPVVSIYVLESFGLKVKDQKSLNTIYCGVCDDKFQLMKSKECKEIDQMYTKACFVFNAGVFRRNVNVYFFEKKSLKKDHVLGHIEFDLTKIKFNTNFETWMPLRGSPDGNETVCGIAHVKFAYQSYRREITESWNYFDQIWAHSIDAYFPHTEKMLKKIREQNILRGAMMVQAVYDIFGDNIIRQKDYSLDF